jgi:hypothetical protein
VSSRLVAKTPLVYCRRKLAVGVRFEATICQSPNYWPGQMVFCSGPVDGNSHVPLPCLKLSCSLRRMLLQITPLRFAHYATILYRRQRSGAISGDFKSDMCDSCQMYRVGVRFVCPALDDVSCPLAALARLQRAVYLFPGIA